MEIVGHLFRGLLTVDDALTVVPDIADNFRVSSDGLTYLFRLREEARWSDGVPVTAEDFVFAWRRLQEEQSALPSCSRTSRAPRLSTTARSRFESASRGATSRTCSRLGLPLAPSSLRGARGRVAPARRISFATGRS